VTPAVYAASVTGSGIFIQTAEDALGRSDQAAPLWMLLTVSNCQNRRMENER
jgi:hypothetical protein